MLSGERLRHGEPDPGARTRLEDKDSNQGSQSTRNGIGLAHRRLVRWDLREDKEHMERFWWAKNINEPAALILGASNEIRLIQRWEPFGNKLEIIARPGTTLLEAISFCALQPLEKCFVVIFRHRDAHIESERIDVLARSISKRDPADPVCAHLEDCARSPMIPF